MSSVALLIILTFPLGLLAQPTLWGLSPFGGESGKGTIFKYENGIAQAVHEFQSEHPGALPGAVKLAQGANGNFYGVTNYGGRFNNGVLFEFNTSTDAYKVLHDFNGLGNGVMGYGPRGSVMRASNGKLYGCAYGGTNGGGVIFEFDLVSNSYKPVHNFSYSSGYGANEVILVEGDGMKLYSVAPIGGTGNGGVLFEFDMTSGIYTPKIHFSNETGTNPRAGLIKGSDGKFYGMTENGGWDARGTIYEYNPATNTLKVLKHFGQNPDGTYVNGRNPSNLLVEHPNGKMYGVTSRGGTWGVGVFFEFDYTQGTISAKGEFGPESVPGGNSSTPLGSLTVASNGNIYGMTSAGDVYAVNTGFIYEFNPTTGSLIAKKSISSSRGTLAESVVDGMLYGITNNGGKGSGTLFRYDPATNSVTDLFSFDDTFTGARPYGTLSQAFNGRFYGMARENNESSFTGIIFEFDPAKGAYTQMHSFNSVTGASRPKPGFVLHPNGKLYAVTAGSGWTHSFGSVIEFDPASQSITHINYLDEMSNVIPIGDIDDLYGELTLAPNGKLYGVAANRGSLFKGLLFEYDPFHHRLTKIFEFSDAFGSSPKGALTLATNGKLYGTTSAGGASNFGALFEFDPVSGSVTKKIDFTSSTGPKPEGKMIQAQDGNLYGLSFHGGYQGIGFGTLYRYDITTNKLSAPHYFPGPPDGSRPLGVNLIEGENGILYGMTKYGGEEGGGTIFEFDPPTQILNVIHSFDGNAGLSPEYTSLTVKKNDQSISISNTEVFKKYGDQTFSIGATASSGLTVTYASSTPSIAEVYNNQIIIRGVGTATIYVMQSGNNFYLPAPMKEVQLVVSKAELLATAKTISRTYGATNPALEIEYTGFVGSDTKEMIDVLPHAITVAEQSSPAGTYPIDVTGGEDDLYSFTFQSGVLTIEKAQLTCRADDKSKKYNDVTPALTYSCSGFVGIDGLEALITSPDISTSVIEDSNAGTYAITLTGGAAANYAISLMDGTFTVEKAPQTITFPVLAEREQTDDPFALTASASSNLQVAYDISDHDVVALEGNIITILLAGTVDITASQAGDLNYLPAENVTRTLSISPVTGLEINFDDGFEVFPNPTEGAFYLKNENLYNSLVVINVVGQVVQREDVRPGISFDISSLPPGIYHIVATSPTGSVSTRLIKR